MRWFLPLLPALLLAGCAAAPEPVCRPPAGSAGITAQLLFGRTMPNGVQRSQPIDDAAWRDFLASAVTPRFPDGLTVLDGYGQWRQRGSGWVVGEPSDVIEIVTDDTPENRARLQAIRDDYKARFFQESVGLVIMQSCASF